MDWQHIVTKTGEVLLEYGPKLVGALGVLIGGWIGAKLVRALLRRLMAKARLDPTLVGFLGNLVYVLLMVVVLIAAIGTAGVPTASFVAMIGAAGLAVGFALQGSLSNFAAGVMIILFRPFRVGDVIECSGVIGSVCDIQVFATHLNTGDNKRIIVPNTALTSANLINYSKNGTRRIDLVFGISYEDDIDKAKTIVRAILDGHPLVLKEPRADVVVGQLADSSVNLYVRPWANSTDYWTVLFDVTESVKKAFDRDGITIPFPQRDVRMHQVA